MKDDSNRSLRRVNRKSRSAADRTVEVDSSAFFAEDPAPTPPPRKKPNSSAPRRSGAPAQAAAARPSAFGRILLPVQNTLQNVSRRLFSVYFVAGQAVYQEVIHQIQFL